jgi:hypothetical protein
LPSSVPLMTLTRGTAHLGTEGDWAKQVEPEREYNLWLYANGPTAALSREREPMLVSHVEAHGWPSVGFGGQARKRSRRCFP